MSFESLNNISEILKCMNLGRGSYFEEPYGIINLYATDKTTSPCFAITHTDSNAPADAENGRFYGHEELNSEL